MTRIAFKTADLTHSACVLFIKHRKRIETLRETGNLKHLYKNGLNQSCFAHDSHLLIVRI